MPKTKNNSLNNQVKRAIRLYKSIPQRILPVQYPGWMSIPDEVRLRVSEALARNL